MSAGRLWGREPALIIGAVQAVLALAVGFGLPVTTEQTALILAASAAVLAAITRQQVTPNASVAARIDDDPPPAVVAGPAADVPTGQPVDIIPQVTSGGIEYVESSDTKADAAGYEPKHDKES